MRMTLMLSHPNCYLLGSFPSIPSNIYYSTFQGPFPLMRCLRIREIRSWPFFQQRYQIPSQPIRMKSSSLQSQTTFMSGNPDMVCRSYGNLGFFLQWRSPRHRERLRWLLILPPQTLKPEATMRYSSRGFSGLWSQESQMSEPILLRADRESPALATQIVFPTMSITLAVHPTESATLLFSKGCRPFQMVIFFSSSSPCAEPSSQSKAQKVSSSAFAYLPCLQF